MDVPFQNSDQAHTGFQYLEDLATAYWYSEVLFASIELGIFEALGADGVSAENLAGRLECREHGLLRLLKALEAITLVYMHENKWYNSLISSRYLSERNSKEYLGDFLLYRKYMQPNWRSIIKKISHREFSVQDADRSYTHRNFAYVKAADRLMLQKAKDLCEILSRISWTGPVLDIGGGAGSFLREILKASGKESERGFLFDLPEVIEAAESIYSTEYWHNIKTLKGDFRSFDFGGEKFGLVVMSNFLHAYSSEEAGSLLTKAANLLKKDGIILIHDYFPDRNAHSPHKGVLYDMNMMLNTYNGECHDSSLVQSWLENIDITNILIKDLYSDTSVIIASGTDFRNARMTGGNTDDLIYSAKKAGLRAVRIKKESIVISPWVRVKCRFGCKSYRKKLQCPPYSIDHKQTTEIVDSYKFALLLQGSPPGSLFHENLLMLEKEAFLSGFHKALAFGAGPCPVCAECPDDGNCRYPDKARPSMEASGIDVYRTAKNAGINLSPVKEKKQYVKYLGLLLLE